MPLYLTGHVFICLLLQWYQDMSRGRSAYLVGALVGLVAVFVYYVQTRFMASDPSSTEQGTGAKLGSGQMFDSVAAHYDRINKYMSLGMDSQWRAFLVDNLQLRSGDRVLDLATGTADVAIQVARDLKNKGLKGEVVGLDPSQGMLKIGQHKLEGENLTSVVQLVHGDAQRMSLPSNRFDKITMSFGIRNVEDRAAALREMHRVLRKNGDSIVGVLEFSLPSSGILKPIGQFMIRYGAPLIGSMFTGLKDEYMHLQRSILNFPEPADFAALMESCGLKVFDIKETGFGAVTLYLAHPDTKKRRR